MNTRNCIVLVKVEMTGLRETDEIERFDGVNWRQKREWCPEAKACVWLSDGDCRDVERARAFAKDAGWDVALFPTDEADPLGKAKAAAMKTA